jgi:hypothetical protein
MMAARSSCGSVQVLGGGAKFLVLGCPVAKLAKVAKVAKRSGSASETFAGFATLAAPPRVFHLRGMRGDQTW